jgi:hypothetical protein
MAKAIIELSNDTLFEKRVRFSNVRYRHREVAARLLFIELSVSANRLIDTKKPFLDEMVKTYKSGKKNEVSNVMKIVRHVAESMTKVFTSKDTLLAAQAAVPVYYLLFREALAQEKIDKITRQKLLKFNEKRQANRTLAEADITKANFELLEFDRMSQQGTNDASSIRERLRIITKDIGIKIESDF